MWRERTLRAPAALAVVVLSLAAVSGCSSPLPTPPTPHAGIDVSGRWVRVDNNGPTTSGWQLVQRSGNVEGTSLDDPGATVPYTTVLSGTLVGYEFTYTGTVTQFFPGRDPQQTHIGGTLTVTGDTMAGQASSVPPVGRPASGPLRMVRVGR